MFVLAYFYTNNASGSQSPVGLDYSVTRLPRCRKTRWENSSFSQIELSCQCLIWTQLVRGGIPYNIIWISPKFLHLQCRIILSGPTSKATDKRSTHARRWRFAIERRIRETSTHRVESLIVMTPFLKLIIFYIWPPIGRAARRIEWSQSLIECNLKK